jgi:hypothetical protein
VVEVAVESEGQLVAVDGAPPPRAGIGADRLGVDADPADEGVGVRGPSGGGVVGHRDLRGVHADRRGPVLLGDAGSGPPHRWVPLRGDREVTPELDRGVGELGSEVPGISAHHRAQVITEALPHLGGQGGVNRPG